jgi:DNA-binding winged helix-turn-helix (wHTH) protein/Flp pilus assembly protein TadD
MSNYAIGPFQLDVDTLLLTHAGRPVALGPKVVETLLALIEHPGEVLAKRRLMERIWPEGFVEEANLSQNIHVLRKTFRQHGSADPIETVPRRGYRFTAPVRLVAADVLGPRLAIDAAATHAALAPQSKRTFAHRIAAVSAGAAFLLASLVFVSSSGFGRHASTQSPLTAAASRQYEIGLYYWNLRTPGGLQKSLAYFAKVVDADPSAARGYAALADANVMMGDYCYGTHRPSVYFARAQAYAKKALALDPNSAEAHAALGALALDRRNMTAAMADLQRALALDPSYGPAQEWYGIALLVGGRSSQGVTHLKTAAELEPLSVSTIAWLGWAAYRDRRFGDAIAYSQEALELSPQRADVLSTIGQAYEAQGDFERAIGAFKQFGTTNPFYRPEAAALLARAYALDHRGTEALAQFGYARAHASDVDPNDLAAAAAAVGVRVRSGDNTAAGANRPHAHARHAMIYA